MPSGSPDTDHLTGLWHRAATSDHPRTQLAALLVVPPDGDHFGGFEAEGVNYLSAEESDRLKTERELARAEEREPDLSFLPEFDDRAIAHVLAEADRFGVDPRGGTLYVLALPSAEMCEELVRCGVARVVYEADASVTLVYASPAYAAAFGVSKQALLDGGVQVDTEATHYPDLPDVVIGGQVV